MPAKSSTPYMHAPTPSKSEDRGTVSINSTWYVSHRLLRPDGRPFSSLWWVPRECLPTSREPLPQAVGSLWASSEPPARPYVCLAGRRVPVLGAKRLVRMADLAYGLRVYQAYTMCDGFGERIADLRRSDRDLRRSQEPVLKLNQNLKYKINKNSTRRVTSLCYTDQQRGSAVVAVCLLYTPACAQS